MFVIKTDKSGFKTKTKRKTKDQLWQHCGNEVKSAILAKNLVIVPSLDRTHHLKRD